MSTLVRYMFVLTSILAVQSRSQAQSRPNFSATGFIVMETSPDAELPTTWSTDLAEIVLFNPSRNSRIRLTHDSFWDSNPSWWYDGTKIVFDSGRPNDGIFSANGPRHIYAVDVSSEQITQLDADLQTKFPSLIGSQNEYPACSPVAPQIAFVAQFGDSSSLMLLDLRSNTIHSLGRIMEPEVILWSPDGSRIITQTYDPDHFESYDIAVYDVASGTRRTILRNDSTGRSFILWYDSLTVLLGDLQNQYWLYSLSSAHISRWPQQIPAGYDLIAIDPSRTYGLLVNAKSNSSFTHDLWTLDFSSSSLKRLTNDGLQKKHVSYFWR